MSKYDNRILDGRHDWRLPLPPISGWEWYDKENCESVFILMLNPRQDAMGDMTGRKKTLLWEEWFAYKGWLRKQPSMWAEHRKDIVEKLAATAAMMGLHDVNKVIGKNGSRTMTPTEVGGKKVPSLRFDNVDCTQLEKNLELFEKTLEATAEMTADEHCEVFKRLHDVIE